MKIRPYIQIFNANLAKELTYRFNYLFTYVLYITQLLIYLAVWSQIFKIRPIIQDYNWDDMASYYALNMILGLFFFPSNMFEMQPLIRKGMLSSLIIKPINFESNIFAKFLATKLPAVIILTLLIILTFQLIGISLQVYFTFLTISVLILTFLLSFSFGLFVSAIAFWLVEMWPIRRIFQGCMALLGGGIAPLDMLPSYISNFAVYTPFPYLGYFCVRALEGQMSSDQLQFHCVKILLWTGLLFVGFKILWKIGLRRYEAVNI